MTYINKVGGSYMSKGYKYTMYRRPIKGNIGYTA
jgi:hypothetical protein